MDREPVLVVGYTDSPESRHGLDIALELADRLGARVHVVHVIDRRDLPIDPDAGDWERRRRLRMAEVREQVRTVLAGREDRTSYDAVAGDPVRTLHEAADRHSALMIVLGVRADERSPLERLFARSVSRGLTHHLDRPVLLVPHLG